MNRRGANLTGPLGGAGMVGLWGASSLIKSVQHGTVSLASGTNNQTATISAVDTNNAILIWLGTDQNLGVNNYRPDYALGYVTLTNSTTVTATRNGSPSDGITYNHRFVVIEFLPGVVRRIQAVGTNANQESTPITITSINTSKTIVVPRGIGGSFATWDMYVYGISWTLVSATEVDMNCRGWGNGSFGYAYVVEFF